MAVAHIEAQYGTAKGVGTSAVQIGTTPPSNHAFNLLLNVTNLLTTVVKLRAYIADTSWSSGEPAAGTKVAAIAFDLPVAAGDVVQISGVVLIATQKLVVLADTAASLDIIASGVDITLT